MNEQRAQRFIRKTNVKTSARVFPCFTCELLRLKRFSRPFSDLTCIHRRTHTHIYIYTHTTIIHDITHTYYYTSLNTQIHELLYRELEIVVLVRCSYGHLLYVCKRARLSYATIRRWSLLIYLYLYVVCNY